MGARIHPCLLVAIILAFFSYLPGAITPWSNNNTLAFGPVLYTNGEPARLAECFSSRRYPGLLPATTQSCEHLLNTLAHGPESRVPRKWAADKATGITLPTERCRITVSPIPGEGRPREMIMTNAQIANLAVRIIEKCPKVDPRYVFGGVAKLEHAGFPALLAIAYVGSEDPSHYILDPGSHFARRKRVGMEYVECSSC